VHTWAERLTLAGIEVEDNQVKVSANRGDCLSMMGLAREMAIILEGKLIIPEIKRPIVTLNASPIAVQVQAKDACPKYYGQYLGQIRQDAQTPPDILQRLQEEGWASVSPVVDILNYVMLELGQPLHAFDAQHIQGDIVVRWAKPQESLRLLNDKTLLMQSDMLIIADTHNGQPLALAGIMGGKQSAVTAETQAIFIESAYFDPIAVRLAARHAQLQTEASYRFERGVDPELPVRALNRAMALLQEIVGGQCGPVIAQICPEHMPRNLPVKIRKNYIKRILGIEISDAQIEPILNTLALTVEKTPEGWQVMAPSHRSDLGREIDWVEEIARIIGYEAIEARMPNVLALTHAIPENQVPMERIKHQLTSRGYTEVITYSFISPIMQAPFLGQTVPLMLLNPISNEMSEMRTSLLPGLLRVAQHNQNRQQTRIRIFEQGACYLSFEDQNPRIGGLCTEARYAEQWGLAGQPLDFFDMKSDLETVLSLWCIDLKDFQFIPTLERAYLQPGQAAHMMRDQTCVGYCGALHPELVKQLDLLGPVFVFELDIAQLGQAKPPVVKPLSKYPTIRRDLALLVDSHVPVSELEAQLRAQVVGLQQICIFDIYQGAGIPSGKKSVGLGVIFEDREATLSEDIVNTRISALLVYLQATYGVSLRG
jgi:phenylalanyl-tRNA synthetase beta chain